MPQRDVLALLKLCWSLHIQSVDAKKCAMMEPERRKNHMATVNNGSNDQEHGLPIPDEPFRETLHEAWNQVLGQTLADQQHLWSKERRAISAEAETIIANLRAHIAELRIEFECRIAEKLAAVRDGTPGAPGPRGEPGPQGRPGRDGRLRTVREWSDRIHYTGDVVVFNGSAYQCVTDTGRSPADQGDWVCIARAGRDAKLPVVRGTWNSADSYEMLDIVACGGASFIARRDNPGICPSEDWQLLAMRGKKGDPGPSGERGARGECGPAGSAAPTIVNWEIDRQAYSATPILSNGSTGPTLNLRPLFEQFQADT
jgi:hypothetical protein